MTRVLIADDHTLFRAGLRQFLAQSLASTDIGEAASGNETLTCLQQKKWDLLVLDINMPDRSGLDILRHVRSGQWNDRLTSGCSRRLRRCPLGEHQAPRLSRGR
jgi:DNA-binding NarL/FixJ family response regulator